MVHGDSCLSLFRQRHRWELTGMGLLWIDLNADRSNRRTGTNHRVRSLPPVMKNRQFGPGHNSFTQTPEGEDVLVYHAKLHGNPGGDPLYDPNRHARLKLVRWDENGMPDFGVPPAVSELNRYCRWR